MDFRTLDYLITGLALIAGISCLMGKGDWVIGKNTPGRENKDPKKTNLVMGIGFLLFALLSLGNIFFAGSAIQWVTMILCLVDLAVMMILYKNWCNK